MVRGIDGNFRAGFRKIFAGCQAGIDGPVPEMSGIQSRQVHPSRLGVCIQDKEQAADAEVRAVFACVQLIAKGTRVGVVPSGAAQIRCEPVQVGNLVGIEVDSKKKLPLLQDPEAARERNRLAKNSRVSLLRAPSAGNVARSAFFWLAGLFVKVRIRWPMILTLTFDCGLRRSSRIDLDTSGRQTYRKHTHIFHQFAGTLPTCSCHKHRL